MITIGSSPKQYTVGADKAVSPDKTVKWVRHSFEKQGNQILSELKRIDTGRLGIPVYLSLCGQKAGQIMPTRKQMGKGPTPLQAQASALMELAERYSYFSFADEGSNFQSLTWHQASKILKQKLIPIEEIIKSTGEDISCSAAAEILSLTQWQFTRATMINQEKEYYIPFNWFRKLNEFNGCSAGNTVEESILQGVCELIERHCCAVIDASSIKTPTIDQGGISEQILKDLLARFNRHGIKVLLKDFSLDMPVPTVAVLAYDPATFPGLSEIVFTAGTATSPAKAAVRALTETAQLAGDFHSASNYEASGLPKYNTLEQTAWLTKGEQTGIESLPDMSLPDMGKELKSLCSSLSDLGYNVFCISTTHQDLGVPANYTFIPGFRFRERTSNASIGLIAGRILAEEAEPDQAFQGLEKLSVLRPEAFYIPFYQGILHIRTNDPDRALGLFLQALDIQPDDESRAMCAFYAAYTLSLKQAWAECVPYLDMAIDLDPLVKEHFNLRGVAFFKQGMFEEAAGDFKKALDLDSGSAVDLANLGLCYQKTGQNKAAGETLTKALELDPTLCYAKKSLDEISL